VPAQAGLVLSKAARNKLLNVALDFMLPPIF
jgi:hypothetical protein